MKKSPARPLLKGKQLKAEVQAALVWLKEHSSKKTRDGLVRFGIPADHALGVGMSDIQQLGKKLGRSQELASALWDTGVYEARLLAVYVGDPERLSVKEMDRWCRDFDNWAIVDTACFKLFDQCPRAWKKVVHWANKKGEFQRRAGFVLLACLAAHDENAEDRAFLEQLPLIERGADDERNFVKKGVSWALRMIGRRNGVLNVAAVATARHLSDSPQVSARWVGRDALKELTGPVVTRRLAKMRE